MEHQPDAPAFFSESYAAARARFRSAVKSLGWQSQSLRVDGRTPTGDDLSIDVAVSSTGNEPAALMLSSGLHGVEGFFGSAVQLKLLQDWQRHPPPANVRIVLLHALNPHGFAWLRRTDAANRDLNRNFLLAGEAFAGESELYPRLDPLLNPRHPPGPFDLLLPRLLGIVARYGFKKVLAAVASGQYSYPQGLFFGGSEPAPLQAQLADELPRWLSGSEQVLHLDLHTGLGRSGRVALLLDMPITAPQRQQLHGWFEPGLIREPDSAVAFYQARGSLGRWVRQQSPAKQFVYMCMEFGTHSAWRVLAAMRAENQWQHWGPAGGANQPIKKDLLEVFCPSSQQWRKQVVDRACLLTHKAIEGLSKAH